MLRMPVKPVQIHVALVAFAAVVMVAGAVSAQLDKDQEKCLNSINKDGAKLAATQGKENTTCVGDKGKGKLTGAVDACLVLDEKGKVQKATDKVIKTDDGRCQGAAQPSFGYSGAATVNSAALDEEIGLTEDVFGSPVNPAILTDSGSAKCQAGVQKAYEKHAATRVKEFLKCKKDGLKAGTITDAASLASLCVFPPDSKQKVQKARDKIEAAADKCTVSLATAFPGDCSGSAGSSAALADCIAARSGCRMCRYLSAAHDVGAVCDQADNGVLDDSCSICGNGLVESGEECDDGAGNSDTTPDACRTDCTQPVCGDGIIDPGFGEDCDDVGESATCNVDCTTAVCGDGKANASAGEECDDGNTIENDFCGNDCTQPPQDSRCPASSELTIYAGARATGCTTDADCDVDGVAIGTCDTGLGRCVTQTRLDPGYTGIGHGGDINDEVVTGASLFCPGPFDGLSSEPCGTCRIQGFDPSTSLCRCSNDNQAVCTETFDLDPSSCGVAVSCATDDDCKVCSVNIEIPCNVTADCPLGGTLEEICLNGNRTPTCSNGQCVGRCDCYFGPPLALSQGNVPVCSLVRFAQDVTGTTKPDSGDGELSVRLRSVVFLGETVTTPCPFCEGDLIANDGQRDGTCVLGDNPGQACDAQALNTTFPAPDGGATSLDCFPAVGKNVTGAGIRIPIEQTTGSVSLSADVECGLTVAPQLCQCGVCSEDDGVVCTSNADCAAEGLGTCGRRAELDPVANLCAEDAGVCTDIGGGNGHCASSALTFCDGALRGNGEPYVTCIGQDDCDSTNCGNGAGPGLCGTCSLLRNRPCFLPTIEATGTPDPQAPVGAAVFCLPPTGSQGIDGTAGFPGPARALSVARAKTFCASDPGTEYVPGVGGCP